MRLINCFIINKYPTRACGQNSNMRRALSSLLIFLRKTNAVKPLFRLNLIENFCCHAHFTAMSIPFDSVFILCKGMVVVGNSLFETSVREGRFFLHSLLKVFKSGCQSSNNCFSTTNTMFCNSCLGHTRVYAAPEHTGTSIHHESRVEVCLSMRVSSCLSVS